MDKRQSDLLYAFVARLRANDLRAILAANEAATHAGAQLGTSAQVAAVVALDKACKAAISNVGIYDRELIDRAIDEAAAR